MIYRLLLGLAAAAGAYGAGALALQHIEAGNGCPTIGVIPICAIVFVGYLLVLASAILPKGFRGPVFFTGWAPVALFAAAGVGMELTIGDVCPKTSGGVPQCNLSFGIVVVTFVLHIMLNRKQ